MNRIEKYAEDWEAQTKCPRDWDNHPHDEWFVCMIHKSPQAGYVAGAEKFREMVLDWLGDNSVLVIGGDTEVAIRRAIEKLGKEKV